MLKNYFQTAWRILINNNLFFQFIAESVLISLLSLVTTILLIQLCLSIFNKLTDRGFELLPASFGLWQVLACTLFTALILNSVYPALVLLSFKPLHAFRRLNILKVKEGFFIKGLVVVQFTISVILIAGTIVIYGGIRKVLGCNITGIAALLSKDFVKLVCIAILMVSPVAWWLLNKWLQAFEYRINMSWWMFAIAGLLAMAIALFTVSFQAIKAAIANPVKSLRSE